MSILDKFESLVEQAIFSSNKNNILQVFGLDTILMEEKNNQQIRATLSSDSNEFADMSRVVR